MLRRALLVSLGILPLACAAARDDSPVGADGPALTSPAADAAPGGTPPAPPSPAIDAAPPATGLTCDDAVCVDPTTGLSWQNPPDDVARTWADAVAYCQGLALRGGGWRLPKIQELRSVIKGCPNTALGGACQATDPTCTTRACMAGCDQCDTTIINNVIVCLWAPGLAGSCSGAHWSSTDYADSIDPGAWYVDYGHGAFVHGYLRSQRLHVRCVR